MLLKLVFYGSIAFGVVLGVSFGVRLVMSGVNGCFNGNPIGLVYILAVYLVFYLLARFVFNRWFRWSSLTVVVLGLCNTCYALIGLAAHYGIHPALTVIIEGAAVTAFILNRRGTGGVSLALGLWSAFPQCVVPEVILDDCAVYRCGWRGFQALQFAEVQDSGNGYSALSSAWRAGINLSFEVYRLGAELRTLVTVWEESRNLEKAVERVREKMSALRDILEEAGYRVRVTSDELETERFLYSPLLAPDENRVEELDERHLETIQIDEVELDSAKQALSSVLDEAEGKDGVGYMLLLQPVVNIEKEFRSAEKELKKRIESLASKRLGKNDTMALVTLMSLTREGNLILQPGVERELTVSRLKCQRMIDARSSGLWNASILTVERREERRVTCAMNRLSTEREGEYVSSLVRRRGYSEKYNSLELSEILPAIGTASCTEEEREEVEG